MGRILIRSEHLRRHEEARAGMGIGMVSESIVLLDQPTLLVSGRTRLRGGSHGRFPPSPRGFGETTP